MIRETLNVDERFKVVVIEALQNLLEISSEKPSKVLSSIDGQSKWRKGWFTSVIAYVDMLGIYFFKSDENLNRRIDRARTSWTSGEMKKRKLVIQGDIDQADTLIEDVLKFLKK